MCVSRVLQDTSNTRVDARNNNDDYRFNENVFTCKKKKKLKKIRGRTNTISQRQCVSINTDTRKMWSHGTIGITAAQLNHSRSSSILTAGGNIGSVLRI